MKCFNREFNFSRLAVACAVTLLSLFSGGTAGADGLNSEKVFVPPFLQTEGGGGAGDGGGGDLIVCGPSEKHVADYFFARSQSLPDGFLKKHLNNDRVLSTDPRLDYLEGAALKFLDWAAPKEAALLRSVQLKFEIIHGKALPEFNDDGIELSPADKARGCHKAQLAIQNLITGTVYVAGKYYDQLSSFDRMILKMHERFIYLFKKSGAVTTAIRKRTMKLFASPEFNDAIVYYSGAYSALTKQSRRVEAATFGRDPLSTSVDQIYSEYQRMQFPLFDLQNAKRQLDANQCRSESKRNADEKVAGLIQYGLKHPEDAEPNPEASHKMFYDLAVLKCVAKAIGVHQADVVCADEWTKYDSQPVAQPCPNNLLKYWRDHL